MTHRAIAILFLLAATTFAVAVPPDTDHTGVLKNTDAAFAGYTLYTPLQSGTTYLVDMAGRVVHTWTDKYPPGQSVYLLDNGHLLRTARERKVDTFHGGGLGGRIREFDWNGKLVWDFDYSTKNRCQHHDIEPLPNGHVLLIAWERKTRQQAIAAGRDPETIDDELWPDCVVEVQPTGRRTGRVVWEWHVWDHLIQDHDKTKANFGDVAAHPELIDINYVEGARENVQLPEEELARLRAIGYIGGQERPRPPGPPGQAGDWNHTNSVAYNAALDQIVLSVHTFNEIWIIDHSTTTTEAAGHIGGKSGKGGDLLYRWGNPAAYRAGTRADQQLFAQHDADWIPAGCPGAAHILVFNNGRGRSDGDYSSVDEIIPPVDDAGHYKREAGKPFGPAAPTWTYTASPKSSFFASHISGAQRLPNGDTLIASGEKGRIFEVSREGATVWDYRSPHTGDLVPDHPGGPRPPTNDRSRRTADGRRPRPDRDQGIGDRRNRDRRNANRPPRPGGPPPFGPRGGPGGHDVRSAIFRATRIAPDHPAVRRYLDSSRESQH
jgi:hypothetical protein